VLESFFQEPLNAELVQEMILEMTHAICVTKQDDQGDVLEVLFYGPVGGGKFVWLTPGELEAAGFTEVIPGAVLKCEEHELMFTISVFERTKMWQKETDRKSSDECTSGNMITKGNNIKWW
jgi:hypothetical protein